ncbi:hypothetical protein BCY89_05930 [Sphingobacterium siyangense]|uniref:Uncharacterized protein n=1 Tax=Sphingobacterium siyangense TaxID=459529 RepID=A0A420FW24_9SPHI|nr:hypothetical protein [Sphingobacterium siyangense]RKF37187.1 hypothetical protein BCY89_05930 [Sphingobacterium siyangense]
MEKSQLEINEIQQKYSKQIEQMRKMLLNMYAVSNIRFWYSCLSNFRKSDDMFKDIMQMDAFATSIIISYGRIFGKGTGTTKLEEKIIPLDLLNIHNEIIDFRHAKYAHHGELSSFERDIEIHYVDSSFIIDPKLEVGVWLGAPKKWAPLFEWLDGYMYDTFQAKLASLTKETGIEWKFPHGPAPSWIK